MEAAGGMNSPSRPRGAGYPGTVQAILAGELAPLKDVLKERTGDQADAAAVSLEMNREDVGVGGYVIEGDDIFMRGDDDADGNPAFVKLTPDTQWTEKTKLGKTRLDRILGMLKLREETYKLIEMERFDRPGIEAQRNVLNRLYDAFVKEHGFINDSANAGLMADDVKIEFGLEVNYRKPISAARAKALGVTAQRAKADKAALLKERVFYPQKEITTAANARDGYGISLSEKGRLDLDYIAQLTGKGKQDVVSDLAEEGLIFQDPETGEWVQEDEYLSGNVKAKLKDVRHRDGFERNVKALEKVLPKDVTTEEIFADLGSTWIPAKVYEEFADVMGIRKAKVHVSDATGTVTIVDHGNISQNDMNVMLKNDDYTVAELFNFIANKRAVVAYDHDSEGKRYVNKERTKLLVPIVKRFAATFRDWVMADPMRAKELTKHYNDTQNTHAERSFDGKHLKTVGANPAIVMRNTQRNAAWRMIQAPVTLLDHVVGAGKTFTIITGVMERRRLGLSRKPMVVVPNHLVGQWAKDFLRLYPGANILAATEKDFSKQNRRRLFSRIATGNFDAIIVGHSSFGFIPMERETEIAFVQEEMEYLERALMDAQIAEDKRTVRTLTNRIAKKRERIARLQHRERDNVATFESMGVDHLTVDESHEFKNLEYSTAMQNVTGMGTPTGAKKSFDLYAKIRYLRSKDGAVTFATGTPISNSLVEMYTLLRYLNLEGLKARRLDAFDAWAKAYAGIETRIEYTATQKLKERGVMAEFNNLPELLQLYTEFADVVSMGDLKRIYAEQIRERNKATGGNEREEFPVPKVKDGGRVLDVETPLESQRQYMDYLVARATRLERLGGQNDPRVDNHLWVMNDARKMALDIRLVDPSAASDSNNKIGRAARNIKRIYDQWNADKGTQLVFCDLSTPAKQSDKAAKKFINDALKIMALEKDVPVQTVLVSLMSWRDRWAYLRNRMEAKIEELDHALQTNTNLSDADEKSLNTWMNDLEKYLDEVTDEDEAALTTADTGFSVYDDLKAQLVEMGIPESEVRFIHEANTKDQKEELFAMVNAGEVRVLIGSSKKMGAGTNVQERIVAEHHLDAPWRPSDVEQREGRAVRQGNTLYERDPEGFELELIAYSTANTFDAVMWQVLARKAEMLEQFRSGVRSVQEGQSDADSYASFMAESTGNPAFKEKFRLEGEIAELEGTQRNIQARRSAAERLVAQKEDLTVKAQNNIDRAEADVTAVADASGFDYDGVHFNEDLDEVEAKAKAEYKAAWTEYETALNEYNNRRHDHWLTVNNQVGNGLDEEAAKQRIAKWDEEHTDEKPAAPKEVSLAGLARMSEAAKLGRIIEKQLDEMEDGEIVVKYGGVEVAFSVSEARFGNSGLKKGERKTYDYSVSVGNYFGSYQAKHPSAREIMPVFRDGAIKRQLARELESVKLQAGHTAKSIAEAELILDKVKFEDAGKLEEKRKRYAEVVEEVNRLESEIEERRESESNPYIDRDRSRFGDYDRRSPERQARQETDENEPVRFALRSDMNNDEALPALVETGLREFEPEMKYPEFAQKMKVALGEMWERFKGLMLKVWQQVRAKFLEERGSFNYREMKVPATERLFERVGVPAGNIFADYVKLQEKHPEYFATAEDVRRHVEFVLENPSDILPATKEGYTLLVRSDGKNRAAVVEFVKRGGKYRVRSAYILEEGQLEIKKQKALHAVSKPIPPENLGENIAEGGGVPSGTLRAEPFSEYRISPTDDEVKYALSAPSGLPASNIKAAFGPIYENLKNAPPWRVVQTAAELPERALKDAERRGIPQRLLQAVYLGNEVVYVADHFNSIEQAKQVILEEVVVHHGLRSILPQAAYEKHMLQAALWYANKRTEEWKALGKTYGLDLKSRSGRIEAAEEMLGRDARTGKDSTLMTRIIAAVKEFLRSIGFDMGYGETEIRELLGRAKRFIEGKESPAPSPQPRTNGIDYGALLRTLRERGITDEQLQAFAAFEPGGARFAFSPSQYQAFDEDTVTGYEGVPDNLMGFGKQPKGFTETKYPYELEVYYSYDKGVTWHDDAIKGMNPLHALERARRNWPDAQIRTLPVDSKFALARLQDVKGQIVDKGVFLNTTEREVLEADREKAVEAIGETVKDYDEPGRFLFRAFYESDQDKAPGVVPYNPERGHYAAGENLTGSWWTTSLATAQEIAWSKARDGRPVKIVALPLDRLPNGNIYIQNTNPPGMVYDLFVGLPVDVPMSAVREMPVDSGIRYALAEPFTAISEQFRSKDVLRNMAKLLNPLDWSRLKRWIEDVTPQNMRNGAATFLRNPVFEAEADDKKKPFVETGVKREETKLDYLLRFLGWDGPAAKAPNVMERLKKTYTQWESSDRTTEWGRITDAFQKLTPGTGRASTCSCIAGT
jgi:N12 class adenine-specific DNA methylase